MYVFIEIIQQLQKLLSEINSHATAVIMEVKLKKTKKQQQGIPLSLNKC